MENLRHWSYLLNTNTCILFKGFRFVVIWFLVTLACNRTSWTRLQYIYLIAINIRTNETVQKARQKVTYCVNTSKRLMVYFLCIFYWEINNKKKLIQNSIIKRWNVKVGRTLIEWSTSEGNLNIMFLYELSRIKWHCGYANKLRIDGL